MTATPVRAELISTLDEKYVSNTVAFTAMIATGTLIVDASSLRGADGALDRDLIRTRVDRLSWFAPSMRQRLVSTPLRLTTPAWVPVTALDLEHHVRFHDSVEPDDPDRVEVLTGRAFAAMAMDKPLWDFTFVELDSGRVAIVVRYHHVIGDALFGLRIGDVLAGPQSSAEAPLAGPAEREALGVAPRTGFGVLRVGFAQWWRQQGSVRGAWRDYWRKPLRKRVRRWVGRLIRPLKNARIARSGLVDAVLAGRSSRYIVVDLAAATKRAYRLGGTVNDLTVAATLVAAARQRPDAEFVSILVPISRRTPADARVRNAISVVKVTVPAGDSLAQIVPSVRNQVQHAVDSGGSIVAGANDWVGYSTYVTWGREQRYFGQAPVETVTGWPAGDPADEIACLACSYRRDLVICVTARESIDVDALVSSLAESFNASEPVGG
ncbi:wax ester/triacylglycerol synthase domain-containing protein [Microbacterium sp.]|uniref:wax ester/triacylglycerol synthase domain-containing protein n=1 Tax=Microbacterium sp. TaxID=51671 RepID=UPI003C732C62